MKLRKKAFVSFTCALALAGNSLSLSGSVFAQDKAQEKAKTETQNSVQHGHARVITTQDGKEAKVVTSHSSTGQFVVSTTPGGGAVFHSQDGPVHHPDGQNFTFVRGGNGQDFTYNFVSSEMSFDSKLVKGAPFVAETENESVKVLPDGNRIVHKNSGSIARDGEGRTRRENTINAVGSFAGNESAKTVTIHDPVAGTMFILEPHSRTARKMGGIRSMAPARAMAGPGPDAINKINVSGGVLQGSAVKKANPAYPPIAKAAKASGAVQVQVTVSEEGRVVDATAVSGHPLLREASLEAARQWEFKPTELSGKPVKVQGLLTFNFTLAGEENTAVAQVGGQNTAPTMVRRAAPFNSNTESLGKQTIEGIEVEGKRTITTIPAGAIGNERSIEIVSETWYSPELQTTIMSKRNDPTSGETSFRLTNIRRGDPDASLFQVPADYTVKEGGMGMGGGFGVGAGGGVGAGAGGGVGAGAGGGVGAGTIHVRTTKPDNK